MFLPPGVLSPFERCVVPSRAHRYEGIVRLLDYDESGTLEIAEVRNTDGVRALEEWQWGGSWCIRFFLVARRVA